MDSLEYKTLNKVYPDLVSCIEQSPANIADKLMPLEILAPGDVVFLRNSAINNDEKARRIIDVVLTQVKADTQVYSKFIEAMKSSGNWTRSTLSKVEEAFETIKGQPVCSPGRDMMLLKAEPMIINVYSYSHIIWDKWSLCTMEHMQNLLCILYRAATCL